MKKLILILVALGLLAVGYVVKRKMAAEEKKEKQSAQLITVEEGPIENVVEAMGEVTPLNRVEIKPPIQGRIESLLVDEGAHVKAGQILAWLSSSDRAAILDAARAQGEETYKKWKDTYKPTPIVAPLSGIIILKDAVVGQTVETSSILFAMSDKLIVLTHVDEVDIGRVKNGLPATITLDAYPNKIVSGHVTSILFEGKNVSNVISYGVKVEPKGDSSFFRSQMTASVKLILEHKDKALLVPLGAIHESQDGESFVFVPGPEKKRERKIVTLGLKTEDNVEITAGLSAGDQILLTKSEYKPQKGGGDNPLVMKRRPQTQTSGSRQRQRT